MQPVCLLLPAQPDLATGVGTLLELGLEARHPAPVPDHILILARVIHDHLAGANPLRHGLWMDRRELIDFLRLLECGLVRLEKRVPSPDQQARLLEAAAGLLVHVRTRLGMARKPVQRQAAPRARAASAVG